jgi:DNA repair protein RecN (Recombination protein N)
MLTLLSIRDIVLIDSLELDFTDGLTVLTGETGAGKSILLDSLSLALGARGDAGLVRQGCASGQVTAVFDVPLNHPARQIMKDNDLQDEGDDLILRRVQNADGRSRAFINDQAVSATLMRSLGATLVEIHGQHDARALVETETHRQLLDSFGLLEHDLFAVSEAHMRFAKARKALSTHEAKLEEARKEEEYLRACVDELTTLGPEPGEEEKLSHERTRMMQAEKVAADLHEAYDIVAGDASAVPSLAGLLRRLERKTEDEDSILRPSLDAIAKALDALSEAGHLLQDASREADFDRSELERIEERLFAIRAAARKYQVHADALPDVAVKMADQLADLDAGEDRLVALQQDLQEADAAYCKAAKALSEKREDAAQFLANLVNAELPDLKLGQATFTVKFERHEGRYSSSGWDEIAFWVQTNPGTNPGPMMKVASGGELSRFLLALKVCLAEKGSAPTLVFDEIDTGVGGAVAEAIGRRLARLSDKVQVLSVTHAPQVAARASAHMLISKDHDMQNALTRTDVRALDIKDRQEEIARMLAGATITNEARAAAQQLLKVTA